MRLSGLVSASGRRMCIVGSVAGVLCLTTHIGAQGAPPAQGQSTGQAPAAGQAPATGQAPSSGQAPAAGQPPAAGQAATPAADPFKFTTGAGAVIWYVKPDKTADFEAVWAAIRNKLSTTDKPELKQIGDTLKIYKVDAPAGPQGVMYLFVADPASPTVSYSPSPFLLFTSGLFTDAEGRELFDKLNGAISSIGPMGLTKM
jgi:hypothetical protein